MSLERNITPSISIKETNLARVNAAHRNADRNYRKRVMAYVRGSDTIPEASGDLKESAADILAKSKVDRSGGFEFWFGFGADYAKYVELGRPRGNFPPIAEIEVWCMTSGLFPIEAASAIAWKIYQKGISPQAFFEEGVKRAKIILREELLRAYSKFDLTATVTII